MAYPDTTPTEPWKQLLIVAAGLAVIFGGPLAVRAKRLLARLRGRARTPPA